MIVLREHEIKAIRKTFDEVFKLRHYSYSGYKSIYFERDLPEGFPNMYSTGYCKVYDFEDFLQEITGG